MAISQTEFAKDLMAMEDGIRDAIKPFLDKYCLLPDLNLEIHQVMGVGPLSSFLTVRATNLRDARI